MFSFYLHLSFVSGWRGALSEIVQLRKCTESLIYLKLIVRSLFDVNFFAEKPPLDAVWYLWTRRRTTATASALLQKEPNDRAVFQSVPKTCFLSPLRSIVLARLTLGRWRFWLRPSTYFLFMYIHFAVDVFVDQCTLAGRWLWFIATSEDRT